MARCLPAVAARRPDRASRAFGLPPPKAACAKRIYFGGRSPALTRPPLLLRNGDDHYLTKQGRKRNRKKSFWVTEGEWKAIERIAAGTGTVDFDRLVSFLATLRHIFKWDVYESSTIGKISQGFDTQPQSPLLFPPVDSSPVLSRINEHYTPIASHCSYGMRQL